MSRFEIVTGDITTVATEAIVHALHCHEVGIRNHVPLFIFSIQTEQILRIHTIFGSSLQHHLVHLPETDEVGRIETPDIGLQSFHRLVHINSQFCRFGQIDPQQLPASRRREFFPVNVGKRETAIERLCMETASMAVFYTQDAWSYSYFISNYKSSFLLKNYFSCDR